MTRDASEPRTIYLVKELQVALRAMLDDCIKPCGLSLPELAVLDALHQTPGLTNAELARAAYITPQSMITVLRSLENKQLIERSLSRDGGKAMPNHVTELGEQRMLAALEFVGTVENRMLSEFSAEEKKQFRRMLNRFLRSIGQGRSSRLFY